MKSFILSPSASFSHLLTNGVDVGMWTVDSQTLVLATNTNYASATLKRSSIPGWTSGEKATLVLDSGASVSNGLVLESVGTGAVILG